MKYSVKKFTALLLALIMVLSLAPLDAIASVFTTYEANVVIDTSDPAQISEALVTSRVTSKDGFSAEISSIDDILPAGGWVGFSDETAQSAAKGPALRAAKAVRDAPMIMVAARIPVNSFLNPFISFPLLYG